MLLIQVVIGLIVIGVLLGLVNKYGAEYIPAQIIHIINAVVIIAIILWLLWWLLTLAGMASMKVPVP